MTLSERLSTSGVPYGGSGHLRDLVTGLWHYATELCTLSFAYTLIGSALTNTTGNQSDRDMPSKNYRFLPVFVPLIMHNLTRATYSLWLPQVVMTGARIGYPRMGEPAV